MLAGTGAVTRGLLDQLPRGSRLDIVESNPQFAMRLRDLLADRHSDLASRAVLVNVYNKNVEDLGTDQRYNVIVSGLPLTNFTPLQVEAILDRYTQVLYPGGDLTYFAYLGTHRARALLASRTEARRHAAVNDGVAAYHRGFATGHSIVWANLPPARVWHLRRPLDASPDQQLARLAARQ